MVSLTTVALLERKPDISRSLFTRYWRDVHGVMAARIPGFESYIQYHVTPQGDTGASTVEPFEGVAIVTFADAQDRAGLASSDISRYIQRDEQNVFRRALLYNLEAGANQTLRAGTGRVAEHAAFLLVPASGIAPKTIAAALADNGLMELHLYDLVSGDPAAWNKTDIDDGGAGRRFAAMIQGRWSNAGSAQRAINRATAEGRGEIAAYRIDEIHVMVDRGRPTQLGLRGWDALRTIHEAGAVNQLEDSVVEAIYRLPKTRGR